MGAASVKTTTSVRSQVVRFICAILLLHYGLVGGGLRYVLSHCEKMPSTAYFVASISPMNKPLILMGLPRLHTKKPLPGRRVSRALQGGIVVVAFVLAVFNASLDLLASEPHGAIFFSQDVQPILSDKCFHCHGPDDAHRSAGLRLDTEAGIREAFAEGNFSESEAWRRILSSDPDEVMPPPETHKSLAESERELIRAWMQDGAEWSPHWAFVPPSRPVLCAGFGDQPIDAFVRRGLNKNGLDLQPRATKEKLLRRATLDLHGLPPTIEEVEAFLNDNSPDAWRHALDRLFDSQRYGERMAVAWLDGARYADTNGYQNDFERTMWPWRDWVIDSFNRNQPFNEFTVEQIAGDLLPNPTYRQQLATAFNRNHRTVTEAGSIPAEWHVENVVDRVETTSAVFLGLTMGCARCHDHKFDPISQEEFYEFFAFFNSIDELGVYNEVRGNVGPSVECIDQVGQAELKRLSEEVTQIKKKLDAFKPGVRSDAKAWLIHASPPEPIAAAMTVRLDGDSFAGVIDGDRVIEPLQSDRTPLLEGSFLGPVASFSGGRRLEYEDFVKPGRVQPLTISAWVLRRGRGAILSKMHDGQAYRGIDWLIDNERLAVHMISHWPNDALKVITKKQVPADQWTLITVAYDGTSRADGVRVYFGRERQELVVEKDTLTGPLHTDQPFRIGRRSSGMDFNGLVGRLRVFYRDLSVREIGGMIKHDLFATAAAVQASKTPVDQESDLDLLEGENDWLSQYASLTTSPQARRFAKGHSDLLLARRERDTHRNSFPTCMVMKELPEPRPTYVLRRGEYDKPDTDRVVQPAVPSFLGLLPSGRRDRLALAEWIVSRDNPLTSRVIVNRLWAQLFGVGIVKSEENLGVQCDAPSHPELLDWLAVEFMESGWDVQHILRLIMSSETYRQSSDASPELYRSDPENRLLARGPRRRLAAEFVRDNALAVSGLLSSRVGGPPVRPYQPAGLWQELAGAAGGGPYSLSEAPDIYRRSLYTIRKRTVPHPTMSTFDAPSFEMCIVKRSTTNTPLQALALLNDVTYVEAARHLAGRMLDDGGADDADRIDYGFRLATSRQTSPEESRLLLTALKKYRKRYQADKEAASRLLSVGVSQPDDSLSTTELAAYASLASLLLNLDETITAD